MATHTQSSHGGDPGGIAQPPDVRTVTLSIMLPGMLLVAFADGELHWDEREALIQTLRVAAEQAPAAELLAFLDDAAHSLARVPKSEWPGLFADARLLPVERQRIVLHVCTRVAFADGLLDPREAAILSQIAD